VAGGARVKPIGTIRIHDTTLSVWDEHVDKDRTMRMLRAVVERLRTRGFKIGTDPHTKKHHPILARWHYRGRRGDLEVRAEGAGRSVKVELFQNLNFSNPNGGEYDFQRFHRMSRFMQRECVVVLASLVRKLDVFSLALDRDLDPNALAKSILRVASGAAERECTPLEAYNRKASSGEPRGEDGWPIPSEYDLQYNLIDRDKRPFANGATKYFRERGYLLRGQVYSRGGNVHLVETGAGRFYVAHYKLFDCERPDLEPHRLVPKQIERLEHEVEKALKAKNYARVHAIGGALARLGGAA